jgi:pimeloyl-ACP methyl ester carboxylesterase
MSPATRQRSHLARQFGVHFAGFALVTVLCGCRAVGPHNLYADAPQFHGVGRPGLVACNLPTAGRIPKAEEVLAAAEVQERAGHPSCVDLYYRAALLSLGSVGSDGPCDSNHLQLEEWQTHRAAVAGFVLSAQRFCRFSPDGIRVNAAEGPQLIPVEYHGFAWRPSEFNELRPAANYRRSDLRRHFVASGVGVPLVVVRKNCEETLFFAADHPFAATAVLQPGSTLLSGQGQPTARQPSGVSLAFYNPLVYDRITTGDVSVPLERDLTAPIAYVDAQGNRNWLSGFLDPFDPATRPKLTMLEPYQRGKIPVIFIHGLLSEPMAWGDLVNELRAQPDIHSQFQFWAYRYPTGSGYLDSAASLRELLQLARNSSDPSHADASLDQMVLVGHSMGGLVARMQITESWDIPWRHFASQPIESIRAPPQERERLRRLFFFEPSPSVTRVVLIGTPHRGSSWSQRLVGRVGTSLVRFDSDEARRYQTLVDANRDIIRPQFQRAQSTSVELLDPESPLLAAMAQMPVRHGVRVHSIIGAPRRTLSGEATDGVVTASSAHYPCATSELWVAASHSELHHDATTIAEVRRILLEHAQTASRNIEQRLSPAP